MRWWSYVVILGALILSLSACERVIGGYSFTSVPFFTAEQQVLPI
jgi:hypothetical protein